MATVEVKKKRVRESKNRKKYWKKADVSEIEAFHEEQRFIERVGGDVSFKKDEQLFLLDRSTDQDADSKFHKKRSSILKEPLKCYEGLSARSKVPVPKIGTKTRTEDEKKSKPHLEKERKLIATRLQQSKKTAQKRKAARDEKDSLVKCKTLNTSTELYDIWGSQIINPKIVKTETGKPFDILEVPEGSEVLSKDQLFYLSQVTRKRRPKMPNNRYQKPSLLPAVEVPKPGASYIPKEEDHQELLEEAHGVEIKKLKAEAHLERVLTGLFPSPEEMKKITVTNKMEEAVGILYSESEDDDEPTILGAELRLSLNPPVLAENRKTKVQRNRQKAHKLRLQLHALKKQEKKIDTQFNRIPVYKAQMKKEKALIAANIKEREQKHIDALYQPKKLSKHKFKPADIEIKLSDELPSSLRTLKPEGSLMQDRMKSFEKRNLIEPRKKTMRKKKWTKKVYKRNYKKGFEDVLISAKRQ